MEAQHTSKGISAFQEDTGVKTALGTALMEAPGDAKGKALRRAQPRQQAVGGRWVAVEWQGRWEGLCQQFPGFVEMEPERKS